MQVFSKNTEFARNIFKISSKLLGGIKPALQYDFSQFRSNLIFFENNYLITQVHRAQGVR